MSDANRPVRPLLSWVVVLLALFEYGWLAYDGMHGFLTGDYVTPASGEYAGQLGPWASLVEAVGLEPRSTLFMGVHVAFGAAGLLAACAYALRARQARKALLVCATACLWYLPFGTLLGAVQITLLVMPRLRAAG